MVLFHHHDSYGAAGMEITPKDGATSSALKAFQGVTVQRVFLPLHPGCQLLQSRFEEKSDYHTLASFVFPKSGVKQVKWIFHH